MLNVVATAAASCELSSGGEESTSRANLTNSVHAFSSRLKKNYKLQSANNFIQQQQQHIQTKNLPVLNSASHPSSAGSGQRQALSPGHQQATANPVIIVHQNNSISSNVNYLSRQPVIKTSPATNPSITVTTPTGLAATNSRTKHQHRMSGPDSMESCSSFSASSSTSSSSASMSNVETVTPTVTREPVTVAAESSPGDDLTYMKGYVNVLKERFTRRSLGSQAFEQFNQDALVQSCNANPTALDSATASASSKTIRMSISDYQRRKQATSGNLGAVGLNSSRLAQSHSDYQRRRSVSPFTSRESIVPSTPAQPATATAHTKYNFNGNLYLNPASNGAKYSREVCSNLVHESKTSSASAHLYAKKYNNKIQFASSEDLCSATEPNSPCLERTISPVAALPKRSLANGFNHMLKSQVGPALLAVANTTKPIIINSHAKSQTAAARKEAYYKSRRSCNHVDQLLPASSSLADTNHSLSTYSSMSHLNATASSRASSIDKEIIKCTYLNEINKDELPKPNFVSSVKNLFEKQINGGNSGSAAMSIASQSSMASPNISQHDTAASMRGTPVSKQETIIYSSPVGKTASPNKTSSPATIKSSSQSHLDPPLSVNCSATTPTAMQQSPELVIENLVDRIKHNGTLVYDHTDPLNNSALATMTTTSTGTKAQLLIDSQSESASPKSTSPGYETTPINGKAQQEQPSDFITPKISPPMSEVPQHETLSFKERKDIFSKQNLLYSSASTSTASASSTKNKENLHSTSPLTLPSSHKRQKIESPCSPANNRQQAPVKPAGRDTGSSYQTQSPSNNRSPASSHSEAVSKNNMSVDFNKTENKENNEMPKSAKKSPQPTQQLSDATNSTKSDQTDQSPAKGETGDMFTLQGSSMPSATDILNCAEAQQVKAKLKSGGQVKMKTFYGGEVIKDVKTLNLATPPPGTKKASFRLNPTCPPQPAPSPPQPQSNGAETFFEFIGACVKLEKSNLSSSNFASFSSTSMTKKSANFRVNFKEESETFEYPSFECMLKEMGIDPQTDPEYHLVPFENTPEPLSFDSFLPGGSSMSPENLGSLPSTDFYDNHLNFFSGSTNRTDGSDASDELSTTKFTKGSFSNFKPSWHNMNYELGSSDNFEQTPILQPINQNTRHTASAKSSHTDSYVTTDILPTKEEDLKRWSTDMDSNILF